MSECHIVDAFPAFLEFWPRVQQRSIDAQIDAWASEYMGQWPELLEMQQEDYAREQEDWRQIARERVFPFLAQRYPAMQEAHGHLLAVCEPVCSNAQEILGSESDVSLVIYVGIGCGAGWVTSYQGSPAILFGLENITEEGWTEPAVLTGLVAHEMGHVVHFHWLAEHGLPRGSGPWWQLATEGFAQCCEHAILGRDTWHMSASAGAGDWLAWCREHRTWLAAEFLRMADQGESVRPFFGSWYDLRGRKQCGYFLGHEVIRRLQATLDLKEIALLNDLEARCRHELERFARGST
jgi:hypothetical protein